MVYVIGGNNDKEILNTVEMYDLVLKQVKTLSSMNERRDELGVAQAFDRRIYAIGGIGGAN